MRQPHRSRFKGKKQSVTLNRPLAVEPLEDRNLLSITIGTNLSTGANLTTYRMALASTAEFTALAGGAAATATFMGQLVSQINDVYGPELGIRFDLVPNNNLVLFTNAATDGYTNGNVGTMLGENQTVLDAVLGAANYDIGHVFGTTGAGANGLGQLGVVGTASKGQGATLASAPDFVLGVLLHELGHQFNATHTFNSNCNNERVQANSFEPGSGSTVMAYSICGGDVLPALTGDFRYFHAASFDDIINYKNTIPGVGTVVNTNNTVPTVAAGADVTIPASTPFTLTATANDPNAGDVLTYTWEQIDVGGAQPQSIPIPDANDAIGPLFRSLAPTNDPVRTFPRLSDILANTAQATNREEHLPTQSRQMNFRVTARDNHTATIGGQPVVASGVNSDDVQVTVVNTGAPFRVTSFNAAGNIAGGSTQTISWDVAGTNANGINAANVRIMLSTDGGITFPFLLATTANDGSHQMAMPNISAPQARIKIQGDGNIFFDISDANFTLTPSAGSAGVSIVESNGNTRVGEGVVTFVPTTDAYTIALNTAPVAPVQITLTASAQAQISLDGTNFAATQTVTLSNTTAATVSVRAIDDGAAEGIHSAVITHAVTASTDPNYPLTMLINMVNVGISDNERPPVIGVDFQGAGEGATPANWVLFDDAIFAATTRNSLLREDGVATTIDLTITPTGNPSFGGGGSEIDAGFLPIHTPSLAGLDAVRTWQVNAGPNTITATWSDLTPAANYQVYVFAHENFGAATSANQTVTIQGATTLPVFTQATTDRQLRVNDALGLNTQPLESFAKTVAADANGMIRIMITRNDGVDMNNVYLAGLAIQDAPAAAAPEIEIQGTGGIVIGDGDTTPATNDGTDFGSVNVTGATQTRTFTVRNTGNANLNLTGNPLVSVTGANASDFTVTTVPTSPVTGAGSTTFIVTFDPSAQGVRVATITVASNDTDESSYDFSVQGTGAAVVPAGVTVTQSGGNTEVNEAGATTDTYTVVLDSVPAANVTITVSIGGSQDVTIQPTLLTFTPINFATPQTVTVQAVDDTDVESTETVTITHSATSADAAYNAIAVDSVLASVLDNDTAAPSEDNFQRADANTLGANWTFPAAAYAIQNNRAVVTNATGAVEATLNGSNTIETDGVAVEADIDLSTVIGHAGVIARASGDRMNQYLGAIAYDGSFSTAHIWKRVNGTWTNLAFQFLASTPRTGKLRLEVTQFQIILKLDGNVLTFAFDRDLPETITSDTAGIRGTNGVTYDNFKVEPITLTKVPLPDADNFTGADGAGLQAKWFQRFDRFAIQGNRALAQNVLFGRSLATLNTTQRERNVVVEADVALNTAVPLTHSGVVARYRGTLDTGMYLGAIVFDAARPAGERFRGQIWVNDGVDWRNLVDNRIVNPNNGQGRVSFQVFDNLLRLSFNGTVVGSTSDTTLNDAGYVGIRAVAGETVDNFSAAVSTTGPTVAGLTIVSGDFSLTGGQITTNLAGSLAVNSAVNNASSVVTSVTLPVGVSAAGPVLRFSGPGDTNWYWGALVDTGAGVQLQIFKNVNGAISLLASSAAVVGPDRKADLTFGILGNTLSLRIGTNPALLFTDNNALAAGLGGIRGTIGTIFENVNVSA